MRGDNRLHVVIPFPTLCATRVQIRGKETCVCLKQMVYWVFVIEVENVSLVTVKRIRGRITRERMAGMMQKYVTVKAYKKVTLGSPLAIHLHTDHIRWPGIAAKIIVITTLSTIQRASNQSARPFKIFLTCGCRTRLKWNVVVSLQHSLPLATY